MEIDGGCHCGKITYRATIDPENVFICHCSDCQSISGAPYRTVARLPEADFTLLSGEPKVFTRDTDSGRKLPCSFCPDCGTRLYHAPENMPDTINIKPGTLDDTSWLEPNFHVWTKSRQRWLALPEGVRCFETQP